MGRHIWWVDLFFAGGGSDEKRRCGRGQQAEGVGDVKVVGEAVGADDVKEHDEVGGDDEG